MIRSLNALVIIITLAWFQNLGNAYAAEPPEPATIQTGTLAGGLPYRLLKSPIPRTGSEDAHWEYALAVGEAAPVYLSRKKVYAGRGSEDERGLDEETVQVTSLDPGRLVTVTWETLPQGQGINTVESNLVLLRNREDWLNVFRDTRSNAYHGGASDNMYAHMSFAFDAAANLLEATWTEKTSRWSSVEGPLFHGSGAGGYSISFSRMWVYRYELVDDVLRYAGGDAYLDIGERSFSIEEVAQFLADEDEDWHARLRELKRLNPGLPPADTATGRLLIDDAVAEPELNEATVYGGGA